MTTIIVLACPALSCVSCLIALAAPSVLACACHVRSLKMLICHCIAKLAPLRFRLLLGIGLVPYVPAIPFPVSRLRPTWLLFLSCLFLSCHCLRLGSCSLPFRFCVHCPAMPLPGLTSFPGCVLPCPSPCLSFHRLCMVRYCPCLPLPAFSCHACPCLAWCLA